MSKIIDPILIKGSVQDLSKGTALKSTRED